jgi:ATP-dependent exoDNAse (exonuclease V) beta subunit
VFPAPGKSLHEERRLAFVALTRARQHVTISYAGRRRGGRGDYVVTGASRFLQEIKDNADVGEHAVQAKGGRGARGGRGGGGGKSLFGGMGAEVGATWEEIKSDAREERGESVEEAEEAEEEEEVVAEAERAQPELAAQAPLEIKEETQEDVQAGAEVDKKAVQKVLRDVRAKRIKAAEGKVQLKGVLREMGVTRGSWKRKGLSHCSALEIGAFILDKLKE